MEKRHPADIPESFTARIHDLLDEFGWYSNSGFREIADRDRGHRPGLSEGQAVDEMVRRDWAAADVSYVELENPGSCKVGDRIVVNFVDGKVVRARIDHAESQQD